MAGNGMDPEEMATLTADVDEAFDLMLRRLPPEELEALPDLFGKVMTKLSERLPNLSQEEQADTLNELEACVQRVQAERVAVAEDDEVGMEEAVMADFANLSPEEREQRLSLI